jgi:hypothetical protein
MFKKAKLIGVILLLAVSSWGSTVKAQVLASGLGPTPPPGIPADYVLIPGGWTHPSCIHTVPNGATVDGYHGNVTMNGVLIAHYDPCPYTAILTSQTGGTVIPATGSGDAARPPAFQGWIEGTQQSAPPGQAFSWLDENITVPQNPNSKDSQTLYFFPGLVSSSVPGCGILQPVLQWGATPIGGGQYWTMASWWVLSINQYATNGIDYTNVGHSISGEISTTDPNIYSVITTDNTTGAQIYLGVETYSQTLPCCQPCVFDTAVPAVAESGGSLGSCSEMPGSPIFFSSLGMWTGPTSAPYSQYNWDPYAPLCPSGGSICLWIGNNNPHCGWNVFLNGTTTELWP